MKNTVFLLLLFVCGTAMADKPNNTFTPEHGYVPDALTAIKIAEAIWLPIYGERIYTKKPFVANLQGEVWTIQGTIPPQMVGGVLVAKIFKKTGEILWVINGK